VGEYSGGLETRDGFGAVNAPAPAGTPREIVQRLNSEVSRALREPDARERLYSIGAEPMDNTPEEFAAFIQRDIAFTARLIKLSGATAE
jgi:tripartite-type tricarboxylate transporter receptor subunit TctC